jgi:hypothetical protein
MVVDCDSVSACITYLLIALCVLQNSLRVEQHSTTPVIVSCFLCVD